LELIFRRQNVQALTVGALSRDETLEVIAVSWIQKPNEIYFLSTQIFIIK
jgi:hypothetical protein